MVRTLLSFLVLLFTASLGAQSLRPHESTGFLYSRETAFGLKVHTNRGFAPNVEFGRLRTYYKTTFFTLSMGEVKHPKEHRQSANPQQNRAFRPFVFGKRNTLLVARAGWGVKRYFSEKAKHKGVAVGMTYSFGPSLGILKPYYLVLNRPDPDNPGRGRATHEKYSEANANIFLDNYRILGASPFLKGLSESGILPGGNASVAFHMDWGAFDEVVKALEIGAMIDVFLKKAPILVSEQTNNRAFLNFFVNVQFGKRR